MELNEIERRFLLGCVRHGLDNGEVSQSRLTMLYDLEKKLKHRGADKPDVRGEFILSNRKHLKNVLKMVIKRIKDVQQEEVYAMDDVSIKKGKERELIKLKIQLEVYIKSLKTEMNNMYGNSKHEIMSIAGMTEEEFSTHLETWLYNKTKDIEISDFDSNIVDCVHVAKCYFMVTKGQCNTGCDIYKKSKS